MKAIARSLVVILVALIAVPALAVSVTITTAVQLLATTALIMGGTQHPLSTPPDDPDLSSSRTWARRSTTSSFLRPACRTNRVAVIYPAEFFPVFGSTTFDDSVDDGRDNLGRLSRRAMAGCDYNTGVALDPAEPSRTRRLHRLRLLAKRRGGVAGQERPDRRQPRPRARRHRDLRGLESHAGQRRHLGPRVRRA